MALRQQALALGLAEVMRGPLVRFSYRVGHLYATAIQRQRAPPRSTKRRRQASPDVPRVRYGCARTRSSARGGRSRASAGSRHVAREPRAPGRVAGSRRSSGSGRSNCDISGLRVDYRPHASDDVLIAGQVEGTGDVQPFVGVQPEGIAGFACRKGRPAHRLASGRRCRRRSGAQADRRAGEGSWLPDWPGQCGRGRRSVRCRGRAAPRGRLLGLGWSGGWHQA